MAGTFSLTARPKRPGAYFNWQARAQEPVLESTLGTVAVAFSHDWGPAESVVELASFGDFLAIYGNGNFPTVLTQGYAAVKQAFQGEGLPGRGGAAKVLAFRMVGTSGLAAFRAYQNTAAAAAITLTAKYPGSFGNNIKIGIEADAKAPGTTDNLVVFVNSTEVERWAYLKTNITALAALINAPVGGSSWVIASAVTSGTALTPISTANPTALQTGDDGNTLLAADYTAWMAALETRRFSLLAPANLTDDTIRTSLVSWAKTLNGKGKRFMSVYGGAAGEAMSAAVTRSGLINDPNVVNLGCGTAVDSVLGNLSTAQLAPRVAGILAQLGETRSLTFARLAGITAVVSGPTDANLDDAIASGVQALGRDSHPTSPIRLEKGVTSWTTTTDPDRPYDIYKSPKFVRTMHSIEVELTEWAESNVIGRMQVNDSTRQYVRGQAQARFATREATGSINPGWSVDFATNPPPSDTDDFVALQYGLTFGRSLEQVLNTVVVG